MNARVLPLPGPGPFPVEPAPPTTRAKERGEELPKWRNPRGLGKLYVRRTSPGSYWLWTSLARRREPTGIRWPHDGTKTEQAAAKREGMLVLERRHRAHVAGAPAPARGQEPQRAPAGAPADTDNGVTLKYALTAFRRDTVPEGSPRSLVNDTKQAVRRLLVHGSHGDMMLTPDALRERVTTLRESLNLAPSSMKRSLAVVVRFGDYCAAQGWIERNPLRLLAKPKVENEGGEPFALSEVAAIVRELRRMGNPWYPLHVLLLMCTGLRRSESLKLKWGDITVEGMRVFGKVTKGKKVTTAPDGRRGVVRHIPLRTDAGPAIPVLLGVLKELWALAGGDPAPGSYILPYRSISHFADAFRAAARSLAIQGTPHQLRDTAVALYRDALHWELDVSCDVLGHSPAEQIRSYAKQRTAGKVREAVARQAEKRNGNGGA